MTILKRINHFIYNLIGPYDAILLTYEHNKQIDKDIIITKIFYNTIVGEKQGKKGKCREMPRIKASPNHRDTKQ